MFNKNLIGKIGNSLHLLGILLHVLVYYISSIKISGKILAVQIRKNDSDGCSTTK